MAADPRPAPRGLLSGLIATSIRYPAPVLLAAMAALLAGVWALSETPLDALPDLSDSQVIVQTEYSGRSPQTVEDQVTNPLSTALVSVPGSKAVRGYSFFGYSLVYVLFEDGTDPYWARSRVTEQLAAAKRLLPAGAEPELGPDGTGVGWIYQYALVSDRHTLQELRALQDWHLKRPLSSVDGVSEVASLGGFVKQYQVQLDPERLRAFDVSVKDVESALRAANSEIGAETLEMGGAEFMVRGRGALGGIEDIRAIPIRHEASLGASLTLADLARVVEAPAPRRGVADLDGRGEAPGGIVVMRQGEDALSVAKAVKRRLAELKAGLPEGVRIVPVYDRSELIGRAMRNMRDKLLLEMLVVAAVCALFLGRVRSALAAVVILPIAVLIAFLMMRLQGIGANILSLGGIAIAVGAMVDGGIILVENAHNRLELEDEKPPEARRSRTEVIRAAVQEVGPTLFWTLLVVTVSFIPVFALEGQEGKLFSPLAWTKTWSMAAAALLSITVAPALLLLLLRSGKGRLRPERSNPVNRWAQAAYRPVVDVSLRRPKTVIAGSLALAALTLFPLMRLGSEFMPPMFEGDLLYMPTTAPGISIAQSRDLLQRTDAIIASFPEVERVLGKSGRAETATDPAGLDMMETLIRLRPREQWRAGMTTEKLIAEMDSALRLPGLANAWTMPIRARLDMLSTGIRTPLGVRISGSDPDTLQRIAGDVEDALRRLPGTGSVFAERPADGNYLDVTLNRPRAARYGLSAADVNEVLMYAVGGMPITYTVEGAERYPVSLRYHSDFREDLPSLRRVPVPLPGGGDVPLEEIADIRVTRGPMVVRSEDARPNAWVFLDLKTSDLGGYARAAGEALKRVPLPTGYDLSLGGQYESMIRVRRALLWVVPLTLLLIALLLYANTRSLARTSIVLAAVPFSLIGAVWTLWVLDYNLSVAVWIGLIALAGLDAETGVVMLLYLDRATEEAAAQGRLNSPTELKTAIRAGAVRRLRPKLMTAFVILAGLLPILWGSGTGSDVMKRIAAPMAGGVVTSVLLELAVYPALYLLWRTRALRKTRGADPTE